MLNYSNHRRYSLVEHLAKIAGSANWRSVRLAMFTAYFDASGDYVQQPLLVVAGFVAHADAWISWEKDWNARLKKQGLEYFHRNELRVLDASGHRFLDDLCSIICAHASAKIGCTVVNENLSTILP